MINAIAETLPTWTKKESNGMKWKVALAYPNFYEKEAGSEEYSAVAMGCILSKRKDNEEGRAMEIYCQITGLSTNGNMCLSGFQNYNGPVTVTYIPFYFCFLFFFFSLPIQ